MLIQKQKKLGVADIRDWTHEINDPVLCRRGYHASEKFWQAGKYFRDTKLENLWFCEVVVRSPFRTQKNDKFVGGSRKILRIYDGEQLSYPRILSELSKGNFPLDQWDAKWVNPDQTLIYQEKKIK